jgi:hypothetical protein
MGVMMCGLHDSMKMNAEELYAEPFSSFGGSRA